jgi:hypothetical protein
MRSIARAVCVATLSGLSWLAAMPAAATDAAPRFVAGLAPWQHPAAAPAIKEFAPGDAWRTAALRGVDTPVPDTIARFLDSQGAWYTPFTRPGMPGPYDLRGMHAPREAKH